MSYYRRRRQRKNTCSSLTYDKNDFYAFCFYLYIACLEVTDEYITDDVPGIITAFINYAKALNKTERLSKILTAEIENFKQQSLLTPLPEDSNEGRTFGSSEIKHLYKEDGLVDFRFRGDDKPDEILINLYRILINSGKSVFSSIINATFFCSNKNCALPKTLNLTKKLKDAVFDISKVQFLVDSVNLSEVEARYILFESRLNTDDNLKHLVIGNSVHREDMLGISKKELKYILRNDQKIKSFGFIDRNGDYDSSLNECIEEQSIESYFADLLKPLDCSGAHSLDSFSVKQDSVEICSDLLKGDKPVSILFYGKPGSGKTELAKSICKNTDKKVYIFKNETEADSDINILGRLNCLLSMEREDSITIVDEADTIIQTLDVSFFGRVPTKTKGTVNNMLENSKSKVIYIINHQQQIDQSTRRRFTFSIKFEAMPAAQLRSIAKSKLEPMNIGEKTKNELLTLLDKYRLTGQSVENIVKTIESMEYRDEQVLLRKAEIVMKENALLLNGNLKMRQNVKSEYDPNVLNASMDPLKIVEMIQNAAKFAENNKGTENGIRMLFYGLSGTGKTELARYISEQLGKPILLKRASDILSKYVGENEQNIRDAFDEATASDSILLFDEADSFFCNRNQVRMSWERSTVNEFLTQMEEFSGILICTTNLRNIMDPAMQRRFHMMVEFKPMKFDGIKTMFERYFPAYHLSNKEIEELEDCESVTPGDFGALAGRIRFMNQDDVNSGYILCELKKLQEEKKKHWHNEGSSSYGRIGFTA